MASEHAQLRFLDAAQAAEVLGGFNPRTVSRWAREGYLPAYPVGEGKRRVWRFLQHDLEQWMSARRTGHSPHGGLNSCAAIGAPVGAKHV